LEPPTLRFLRLFLPLEFLDESPNLGFERERFRLAFIECREPGCQYANPLQHSAARMQTVVSVRLPFPPGSFVPCQPIFLSLGPITQGQVELCFKCGPSPLKTLLEVASNGSGDVVKRACGPTRSLKRRSFAVSTDALFLIEVLPMYHARIPRCFAIILATLLLSAVTIPQARGSSILSGALADALNYVVLYEGTGGHNLQITNVTVNGNIGVGGTAAVQDNGPSTINGRLDFSAANTGQFHNNNGANVGPTSVNYNRSNVSADLANLNSLSASLSAEAGTSLAINGNQTIDTTGCTPDASGNCIFNVTSYHENDGNMLTIKGDGTHSVVFDFSADLNLGGDVTLNGLTSDMVAWNFTGSGNVQLNNNASSFPSQAFQGIILSPNNSISLVNANLNGRAFGGDSQDMQIVSGTTISAPPAAVPEPGTFFLLGLGLIGLCRWRLLRT
jgi:hypothetical protein